MKASFPADPRLFFCVLRTLAELRSADCRFGGLCESYAGFAAAKTSGLRVAALPRGRNHTSCRQARTAQPSGRAKRAEKGPGRWRASLLAIQIPDPFFV